jgi:Flp pilus assembly protein TadD
MNYIMMKRYADARKIFTELALTHRSANTVFYNLGLAHKALEDYPSAAKAFRSAVEVSSVDADSRFELGYCLYKTGDTKGARAQYEKLLGINEQRAQDLKKQAKIY